MRVFPVAVAETTNWFFPSRSPASTESAWTGSRVSDFWSSISLNFFARGRFSILTVASEGFVLIVSYRVNSGSSLSGLSIRTVLSRSLVLERTRSRKSTDFSPYGTSAERIARRSSSFAHSQQISSLWNLIDLLFTKLKRLLIQQCLQILTLSASS